MFSTAAARRRVTFVSLLACAGIAFALLAAQRSSGSLGPAPSGPPSGAAELNAAANRVDQLVAKAKAVVAPKPKPGAVRANTAAALTCGAVVTASVTLTQDLSCPAGTDALYVGKGAITINLGGHTISENDPNAGGYGIVNGGEPSFDSVVITGPGTIFGFDTAIYDAGSKEQIKNLHFVLDFDGIDAFGTGNTISGNVLAPLGNAAVSQGDGLKFTNNTIRSTIGGVGMYGSGDTVSGNVATNNHGNGFDLETRGATVTNNIVNGNGANGVVIDDPSATVTGNTGNYNLGYGIISATTATDGGKNTAKGNGNAAECVNLVC
jgi:parallel beta-helix repeat protein